MIDLRHPLAVLVSRMAWLALEMSVSKVLARPVPVVKRIEGEDLFGPVHHDMVSPLRSAGRPRMSLRALIALLCLGHAFTESDEVIVERWSDSPT